MEKAVALAFLYSFFVDQSLFTFKKFLTEIIYSFLFSLCASLDW